MNNSKWKTRTTGIEITACHEEWCKDGASMTDWLKTDIQICIDFVSDSQLPTIKLVLDGWNKAPPYISEGISLRCLSGYAEDDKCSSVS